MRKIIIILVTCSLAVALAGTGIASAAIDGKDVGLRGIMGQAGKSNNAFIELWEKDSETWEINTEGAWGKLKYSLTGTTFFFHFNGHGLEPGSEYALIYYPDPWPGTGLIVFGSDIADEEGNVHIMGSVDLEALPIEADENEGAKTWLVLADDVGEEEMVGWNPVEYLFEYDLIIFNPEDAEVAGNGSGGNGKASAPGQNKNPGEPAIGKGKNK